MDGYGIFQLREIDLSLPWEAKQAKELLASCDIRLDRLDYAAGIFEEERLVCFGGYDGATVKCIAVDPLRRGEALANRIISHLVGKLKSSGVRNVKVFTKPSNEEIFADMGFRKVGSADSAILMENGYPGISGWLKDISASKKEGKCGAVVLNANPFTNGHRYLIEKAAADCDCLHLFVVREDRSVFPFEVRYELVRKGVADLENVVLHDGGDYIISSSTFPSYFLKEYSSATEVHASLDADIFARKIAPALGITLRFVGSEPFDRVTAAYNAVMETLFPKFGIRTVVIDRLTDGEAPVSASRVRTLFAGGKWDELSSLVPQTTLDFLRSEKAVPIAEKIGKQTNGAE